MTEPRPYDDAVDIPAEPDEWETVLAFLQEARISDVLLPGWVDRSGRSAVLRPLASTVYLESDSGYLQLSAVNNCGGLRFRVVEEIEYESYLTEDPDEDLVAASVGTHYLGSRTDVPCVGMRLFVNDESDPERGIYRAAELMFEGAEILFDPFYLDGVRIGTSGTADVWLEDHRGEQMTARFGPLREVRWSPTP
ncbi:hypothetical protein [Amycolatopsis sp. NPDC051128]|uniref:hypothetical protein n=1 Tax=Amycolatopsis sp. NPDC051128 TaxID=3155412 RepID=UPI00342CD35A